jgi:hypothetical protein
MSRIADRLFLSSVPLSSNNIRPNLPLNFSYLAGEIRFIDHSAQLRFEAIDGNAYDICTDFAHRAEAINTEGGPISRTNPPLDVSSEIQSCPAIHERTSRKVEAGSDVSVSPFNDNATPETWSSRPSITSQSQWSDPNHTSSPNLPLLPERDSTRLQIATQSPFNWIDAFDGCQCACLMLFFIEKLAPHVRYHTLPYIRVIWYSF